MSELARRIASAQLQLVVEQVARVPVPLAIYNVAVLWLIYRLDFLWLGLPWLAMSFAVDAYRWRRVRTERHTPSAAPEPALRLFSWLFVANAVLQAVPTPWMFSRPVSDVQYIYTLLAIGRSAGALSTVGGVMWAYAAQVGFVGTSLVLGWAWQGSFPMLALAALIGMLFVMLTASMRDQSRMLRRLVQVAWENEQLVEAVSVERDKARAASDSKTRFFAAASHDLRQPLHALSINTTTLDVMARRQADPAMMELSQSIGRALRQSNSLLDSLLDISQLEANVVNVRRRPVHAVAFLQGLRDEFAAAAAQRGLPLTLQTPPNAEVWLDTDPKQLRRVLANLISNALKFTNEGGVTLLLQAPGDAGAPALLAVVDTGPGIPEAEHERVFEDFYQIGNPSRDRSHGLGLGLSIVRRTAALLDVQVRLTSREGQGARFELGVPTCDPPSTSVQTLQGHDVTAEAEPSLPVLANLNLRVLAIDDEIEILESLAVLLPNFGCEVRCATGLIAAQAVLDSGFEPALLIVDHRLRGETSAEVVAALHTRLGRLPTVIVTGDTAPEELRRMKQMGAHVMHKPIDGQQLAQVLHAATTDSTDRSMFPA